MKAYHLLNTCLALIAGCIMFASCSDDDEPLKGNITLSTQNITLPEGATVTSNGVTVDGKGGSFSIPLTCGMEDYDLDITYTVTVPAKDAAWCKATITDNKLNIEVSVSKEAQGRSTTVTLTAVAAGAEIAPLELTINQGAKITPKGEVILKTDQMTAPANAKLEGGTLDISYIGGEVTIPVGTTLEDQTIDVEYALTVPEGAKWFTADLTGGTLNIRISPTAAKSDNTAEITVAATGKTEETEISSLRLSVKQAKLNSSMDMVVVEGGTFKFGEGKDYTQSYTHDVTVSSFYIATTEITQKLYNEIMGENPSDKKFRGDNYPVNKVDWAKACEFCNKLSEKEGLTPAYKQEGTIRIEDIWFGGVTEIPNYIYDPATVSNGYRIPTSAEWEFAAKGGNEGCKNLTVFSGSDNYSEAGWWQDNSAVGGSASLHEVAKLKANQLGIYDMSGNVGEWCYDYGVPYGYEYPLEPETDPIGPAENLNDTKIYRGGYYSTYDTKGKVYYADKMDPTATYDTIGFRVVRTIK